MRGLGTIIMLGLLLLNSLVHGSPASPPPTAEDLTQIQAVVNQFFSIWSQHDCQNWTSAFTANGTFFHPNYPEGVYGQQALLDFCTTNLAKSPESTFRQDGPIMLTPSGGFYICLAPYVYASTNPDFTVFINSGWEALTLQPVPGSPQFQIFSATEFFSRNIMPDPLFTNPT